MMEKNITLKRAFDIWNQESDDGSESGHDIHASQNLLRRFLQGDLGQKEADRWKSHLANCRKCRIHCLSLMEKEEETTSFVDVAFSKAAAGGDGFDQVTRIPTSSGKGVITIRQKREDENCYLITLNLLRDVDSLEGLRLEVRDKNGLKLLEGVVSLGEISGWVSGLEDFDLTIATIMRKG